MPLAELEHVHVHFGRRPILYDISLRVEAGDFWTLIGPNGAGKSTLLGLFNALTPTSSGTVGYAGQTITFRNAPRVRTKIAHVFQATNIDPKMPLSVFEFVLGGTYGKLGLLRKPGRRERELTQHALEVVGLAGLEKRPIGHLSGGERQRTALARALAQEPELLLLDEPTASLDWQAQREILNTIAELRRKCQLTVFMVTHDLNAVFSLAGKVAMLKAGRLMWQGPAEKAMDADLLSALYDVPITIAEYEGRKISLF
jgi:ABC-type cobalamin/Fe3+-siderophores transport system ATPase subunit